uniref:Protein delta homolog 2 n=1 Tax=Anolis carolinensis TaxID=28377 RepID=A0A803SUN5_ANOCA
MLYWCLIFSPQFSCIFSRCDPGWDGASCEQCVRMLGCIHGTCHQPWQCICQSGWAGKFCDKDVHICEHQPPCQNGAECIYDRDGEYSCLCLEEFHGKDCELKTGPYDCLMQPCANGATCLDGMNRFSCQCQAGFEGRFCTINIDDCANQPCRNGAKCYDRINDFDCLCPEGFVGKTCDSRTSDHFSGDKYIYMQSYIEILRQNLF